MTRNRPRLPGGPAQASSDIDGLPDNKWPPMAVDANSVFDDATVLDGTNKWSVKTDRVTQ